MRLFYWSAGGVLALVGVMLAIATVAPEPSTRLVSGSLFTSEDPEVEPHRVCYQVTQYVVFGYRWGEAKELAIPACSDNWEIILFECAGNPLRDCKQVFANGLPKQKRPPVSGAAETE